jgi:hypothetical protein
VPLLQALRHRLNLELSAILIKSKQQMNTKTNFCLVAIPKNNTCKLSYSILDNYQFTDT